MPHPILRFFRRQISEHAAKVHDALMASERALIALSEVMEDTKDQRARSALVALRRSIANLHAVLAGVATLVGARIEPQSGGLPKPPKKDD